MFVLKPIKSLVVLTVLALFASLTAISNQNALPEGFVYVTDIIPTAQLEIRYFSDNNFVGTVVYGYEAPKAIQPL
ncbi:MAG: M15 family metallopeptidase [Firmicutes bacterium]|nr:M15 family metallopeptidase [Bacillota bacterium]